MKNALILLAILCLPLFISSSKIDGAKFIGEWKVMNKNREINSIVIKQKVDFYTLTYHCGKDGSQWSTCVYQYKNDSLLPVKGAGYIAFISSSGHLKWNGDEWEKLSGKK